MSWYKITLEQGIVFYNENGDSCYVTESREFECFEPDDNAAKTVAEGLAVHLSNLTGNADWRVFNVEEL